MSKTNTPLPEQTPADVAYRLEKDLELCNRATPPPWRVGHNLPSRARNLKEDIHVYTEHLEDGKPSNDIICCYEHTEFSERVRKEILEDMKFIAEAREGWPYAVRLALHYQAQLQRIADFISSNPKVVADHAQLVAHNALYKPLPNAGLEAEVDADSKSSTSPRKEQPVPGELQQPAKEAKDQTTASPPSLAQRIEALKYYGTANEGEELFCQACSFCYHLYGLGEDDKAETVCAWAEEMAASSKKYMEENPDEVDPKDFRKGSFGGY